MSVFIKLLRQYSDELERHYDAQISSDVRRAIAAMLRCKTEQQGRSQWFCSHCRHHDRLPLSCGHRHCPQCLHRTTSDWLERQKQKLLPVHYYMVTFTLPYELRVLARSHPKALYQAMFSVASGVLKDFAQRQHKGELGFTSVLHTHSRQRNLHPHLHVIVAGGRYDSSRQVWHKGNKRYLFNAFALAKVWRARLLDTINQDERMWLPKQLPKKWVVDCRCVGYGLPALQYLSRYLYRGVLPDRDIIRVSDTDVTFRYLDGQTNERKTRTLPILKFLWLILQHVLPKGMQRVRVPLQLAPMLWMDAEVLRGCFSLPSVYAVDSQRAIIDIRLQRPLICPVCITEKPHIKEYWKLAHHTHCIENSGGLIDSCPSCAQPLKWSADLLNGCTNPDCTFQWNRYSAIPQSLPLYQQAESCFTESENTEYLRQLYQMLVLL